MKDVFLFIQQGWNIIWKQKTIWLFSALPVLDQLISVFQRERELSLLQSLIVLIAGGLSLVSYIGVPYIAYCYLLGKSVNIKETLFAIRKFAGRIIGCSCLAFLVLSPCIFFAIGTSMDNTTKPPQISNQAFLILLPLSLFSAMVDFSMFGFFANNSGIRRSLRDAWALFTAHFSVLATLGIVMTIMIGISNAASGILTMLIQSGFDTASLSELNYINPSTSLNDNILFVFLSGISQTIFVPFSASVFAVAYLKYSKIEIPFLKRQNQPKTPF